jgi:hypothetical protein
MIHIQSPAPHRILTRTSPPMGQNGRGQKKDKCARGWMAGGCASRSSQDQGTKGAACQGADTPPMGRVGGFLFFLSPSGVRWRQCYWGEFRLYERVRGKKRDARSNQKKDTKQCTCSIAFALPFFFVLPRLDPPAPARLSSPVSTTPRSID